MKLVGAFLLLTVVAALPFANLTIAEQPTGETISMLDVCGNATPADMNSAVAVAEPVFDLCINCQFGLLPQAVEQVHKSLVSPKPEKPPQV